MVATAKITSKSQITLPKEVRALLGVEPGCVVVFEQEGNRIVVKPAKTLSEFKGILKGVRSSVDYDEIRKKAKNHVGKRGR